MQGDMLRRAPAPKWRWWVWVASLDIEVDDDFRVRTRLEGHLWRDLRFSTLETSSLTTKCRLIAREPTGRGAQFGKIRCMQATS